MNRVLVTGATGYVGRHLTAHLAETTDALIVGYGRRAIETDSGRVTGLRGDLLQDDLEAVLEAARPDTVFHAVGLSPLAPFEDQLQTHVAGTRRLLEAVRSAGAVPRVVIVGSAAEYGPRPEPVDEESVNRPVGEYGICKLAQTQLALVMARRYDLPVVVGRVFNVYGGTSPALAVASLASQIVMAERQADPMPLHVQKLTSTRDFVHISDVAAALAALAERGRAGEIYNIASGESTSIQAILDGLLAQSPLSGKIEIEASPDQTPDHSRAVIAKIMERTGWQPVMPLAEGLARELEYWRAQAGRLVKGVS